MGVGSGWVRGAGGRPALVNLRAGQGRPGQGRTWEGTKLCSVSSCHQNVRLTHHCRHDFLMILSSCPLSVAWHLLLGPQRPDQPGSSI